MKATPASNSPSVHFHPGQPLTVAQRNFKTSADRRERNKASQRESRRRRQDRLDTLEAENAVLRKALQDARQGLSSSQPETEQISKFTGAIYLGGIEPHLDDTSAKNEGFSDIIAPLFAQNKNGSDEEKMSEVCGALLDVDYTEMGSQCVSSVSGKDNGTDSAESEKSSGPTRNRRDASARRRNMWQLALAKQPRTARSFAAMIVVPELVLYKVCRLYFSLILPFSTKFKSGIVNLRAAQAAPDLLCGSEELLHFRSDGQAPELVLPRNFMPTAAQNRIGFHPVKAAVIPFPSMRDKVLGILAAFNSIEGLYKIPDGARIIEEDGETTTVDSAQAGKRTSRTGIAADMSSWAPQDKPDPRSAMVVPDRSRCYTYGFTNKPKGSPKLRKAAQDWLDAFFVEVVTSFRVWCPAADVFDLEGFELRESFFEKYPSMVDEQILRSTNRWRRARGEKPIKL